METIVIKKGKNIDSLLVIASFMFIALLVYTKEYIVLAIPTLLCVTSLTIDLFMWYRWQRNPAIVLTQNYIIFNHNLLFHNQKVSIEHLQLNNNSDSLTLTVPTDLTGICRRIYHNENKVLIVLNTLHQQDKTLLFNSILSLKQNK